MNVRITVLPTHTHSLLLLPLPLQTRLVAAFFFALSNLLFWWVGKHSCTSFIETWMGLTPMEVRAASTAGATADRAARLCGSVWSS